MQLAHVHHVQSAFPRRSARGQSPATVQLAALNAPETPGQLGVVVEKPALGPNQDRTYYIEYRRPQGWDRGLPNDAVLVHEVRQNGLAYLLRPALVALDRMATPDGLSVTVQAIGAFSQQATVVLTLPPPDPAQCRRIRSQIKELRDEIAQLQADLHATSPGEKADIVRKIQAAKNEVAKLRKEAAELGCDPVGWLQRSDKMSVAW